MAHKKTKSTRRARAKKETTKKIAPEKAPSTPAEPVIIAEGSDEPVVKAARKAPAKKPAKKPANKTVSVEATAAEDVAMQQAAEEMVRPSSNRLVVSLVSLAIIVAAVLFGAGIMRQQQAAEPTSGTPSGSTSAKADSLLEGGGRVCTNDQATSDVTGSSNPQSVGMVLQSNPTSTLQTPQTLGSGGNEAATLQGASCF